MSRRTFFFTTLLASLIGGFFAVWLYIQLSPGHPVVYQGPNAGGPEQVSTARWLRDGNFSVPEGINFVLAAEQATPAVVHIRSTFAGVDKNGRPGYDIFRDFFDDDDQRYRPEPNRATGSGVIISEDGYVITNNHVVEDAKEVEITLWNDQRLPAEVVGVDPTTDLALVKVDAENLPHLNFANSDDVRVGEWVLAVGNPFDLTSTVTAGIVSAKARNINILGGGATIESFIQTDAAVNPGNSGGALVNLRGELVGVNTAIASRTGSYVGYSFAVPANLAQKVAEDLKNFGEVQRALLGVRIVNVSDLVNNQLGVNNGVYINTVTLGSSADDAGLQEGDVIMEVDGRPTRTVAELQEIVGRNRPGDQVEVTYLRQGETHTTTALLKNPEGETAMVRTSTSYSVRGGKFEAISAKEAHRLDVKGGVKVSEVEEGPWQDAGIPVGFIITAIGDMPVESLSDLQDSLDDADDSRLTILGYEPDGSKAYYIMDW